MRDFTYREATGDGGPRGPRPIPSSVVTDAETDAETHGFDFDRDTAVRAVGEGRYATTISDRWTIRPGAANGGYALALCLRALGESLPFPDPLTVSATFLRPSAMGPAQVQVELIRTGRRLAFAEARLVQDGRELVRVVASYTRLGQPAEHAPVIIQNAPPVLPPLEQCSPLYQGRTVPGVTIAERIDFRVAEVPGWVRGQRSGNALAEFYLRFADGRDPDTLALAPLADTAPPVLFELGPWSSTTVELSVHVRAVPQPGWLAARVLTRHVSGGFHEEDVELWDSTGVLVAQSRQLALIT